jgi:hypothetical protein
MKNYAFIGAGGAAAAIIVVLLSLSQYSGQEYSLDVDAFKDEADLMGFSRVILTNTGRSTITNIVVDFGNQKETLPKLPPGGKVIVSPKSETQQDHVIVTADHGISITKEYRMAPKAPGMIGGMR